MSTRWTLQYQEGLCRPDHTSSDENLIYDFCIRICQETLLVFSQSESFSTFRSTQVDSVKELIPYCVAMTGVVSLGEAGGLGTIMHSGKTRYDAEDRW